MEIANITRMFRGKSIHEDLTSLSNDKNIALRVESLNLSWDMTDIPRLAQQIIDGGINDMANDEYKLTAREIEEYLEKFMAANGASVKQVIN